MTADAAIRHVLAIGESRERDIMHRRHAVIRQVPCRQCKAAAGDRCRHPGGFSTEFPHQSRRSDAYAAGFLPLEEER